MLRWLFGRRIPRRHLIFHYYDGKRKRSADPVTIERALIAVLGNAWRGELESLSAPLPEGVIGLQAQEFEDKKEKTMSKVLYAIDSAFDVQAYKDGVGLTEIERLGLLTQFNLFARDLVELARPFVRRQSRASPGSEPQPTTSGVESTSPVTGSIDNVPSS